MCKIQIKPKSYRIGLKKCTIKDKDLLLKLDNASKKFVSELLGKVFELDKTPNNRDFKNEYLRSEFEYYIVNRLEGKKKTKQGKVDKHVIPIGLLVIQREDMDDEIIEVEIVDLFISKEFRRKGFGFKTLDVLRKMILKDYRDDDTGRSIDIVYELCESISSNEDSHFIVMEEFLNSYGFINDTDDECLYRLEIKKGDDLNG